MIVNAKLKYLNISPRKVRLIADMIKGLDYVAAENQLKYAPNRACQPLLKLIRSAKANAVHNFNISEDSEIKIKNVIVSQGPMLKRWRPRAFGRAYTVRKRRSHVLVELECKADAVVKPKKQESTEPAKSVVAKKEIKTEAEKEQTDKPTQAPFQKKNEARQLSQKENTKRRFFQRKVI